MAPECLTIVSQSIAGISVLLNAYLKAFLLSSSVGLLNETNLHDSKKLSERHQGDIMR
jgi:hypothetical protein